MILWCLHSSMYIMDLPAMQMSWCWHRTDLETMGHGENILPPLQAMLCIRGGSIYQTSIYGYQYLIGTLDIVFFNVSISHRWQVKYR